MSNHDHLLVPVVNKAPDCQYTRENVTCLSNEKSLDLFCAFSQQLFSLFHWTAFKLIVL
jgi:hypothetical protein